MLLISKSNPSRRHFLKSAGIGVLGALHSGAMGRASSAQSPLLCVGTYTRGKSEGIYIFRLNLSNGELEYCNTVKRVSNPSFLAVGRSRQFLYAVNEITEFAGNSGGSLSAFSINHEKTNLSLLNQQPSLGGAPCYLSVDGTGRFLLTANYAGSNVSVFPILSDGRLGEATDMVQHKGSGPNRDRQEGPHPHCVILDRSNRHAFGVDLGLDKVMIYDFDSKLGKLSPGSAQKWADLKPGAGPRHLAFHPSGKHAYVINELDSTITVFDSNAATGSLSLIETVSTLPKNFSGNNLCADIHVSASGRFLYGSNRGHNSIVVFEIDKRSGRLTYREHADTLGKTPRNFALDPSGRFLLAANQESDSVVTFRVNQSTGLLRPTGDRVEVPTPVCLKFL